MLELSQATVSRLLKRAENEGIVHISVYPPTGCYPDLKNAVERRYNLKSVVVVDSDSDSAQIICNLGAGAAYYLETTIRDGECIGISSWSETLLATANAVHQLSQPVSAQVIQILGGVGNPAAETHAVRLTSQLARLVNGSARLLPVPGVIGSPEMRAILLSDPYAWEVIEAFDKVTLVLVGIGALEPSRLLASTQPAC